MKARMALSHRFNGAARNDFISVPSDTLIGASGEITSTAADMMRLAAFILGDNVPPGTEILQQAAAAGLAWGSGPKSVPNTAFSPHESNVSTLGVWFRELFTRPANPGRYGRYLNKGGAIGGHQTRMAICPDTKTAVVVLVNNQSAVGSLAAQIMDRVLNATYSGDSNITSRYSDSVISADRPREKTPFNDFDDLVSSYSGANADVDIALNEDFTIELPINNIRAPAGAGTTLTIRSANPASPVTLTRGTTGNLFTVPAGATLIFRDIIIDGGNFIISDDDDDEDEYDEEGNLVTRPATTVAGSLVRVNSGSFIMNAGAVLRNNVNMPTSGNNTSAFNGGGVVVSGTGIFTMNGGEITGNKSSFEAGGVYVDQNATFTMTGGKIYGNTANNAGGVYARRSTFTMSGGQINGNTAATNAGGVRVLGDTGTFTMSGGEISVNTATTNGGGIYIENSGKFTMTGGTITGNTVQSAGAGGGVAIAGSNTVFTMNGGEIIGNKSGFEAGGVYVDQNTTFNMTGGKIYGNTANNAGGVYARRSTFTMSNGQINGNTSATNAGGVRVLYGTFTMSGGEISGNTATADGGGIYIENNNGTFTMNGGVVSGNTAGGNGNGVRRANGTFNLNGGAVAGTGSAITNVISGTYILNAASPNNAVIIAWNRPADTPNYTAGSSTNLTVSPNTATAVWANQGGLLGISYANGSNTGWIKQW
jgi:hypothetical protein